MVEYRQAVRPEEKVGYKEMKTEYNYSIESNIELQETNLNIANCKASFFVNRNNFLSKIKLIIKGSILETEETAHKIIKFINDIFVVGYGSCKVFRTETKELSDENTLKKQGNIKLSCKVQVSIRTEVRTRKAIKNKEELEEQINDIRFKKKAKVISAFADGLRSSSVIDRYRNFFEVIEGVFNPRNRRTAEDLKKSPLVDLINDLKKPSCSMATEDVITTLVDLRSESSHLKPKKGYGFSTSEMKDVKKIKKHLPLLEKIARKLIV